MATKAERLQIRVDPDAKRRLEEAAEATNLSVSAFVLQSASRHADEVIAERTTIKLSAEAAAALVRALDRPGTVNQRLASALRRRRTFTWLD